MSKLKIYEAVNKCETFEELAKVIESLANDDGMIQGRKREFNAAKMAEACRSFTTARAPNVLTREFGIRQQALYIQYYKP